MANNFFLHKVDSHTSAWTPLKFALCKLFINFPTALEWTGLKGLSIRQHNLFLEFTIGAVHILCPHPKQGSFCQKMTIDYIV